MKKIKAFVGKFRAIIEMVIILIILISIFYPKQKPTVEIESYSKFVDMDLQMILEKTGYHWFDFIGEESCFYGASFSKSMSDSVFLIPSCIKDDENQISSYLKEYNRSDFLKKYRYFILDSTLRKAVLANTSFQRNLLKSQRGVFYAKKNQLVTIEPWLFQWWGFVIRKDYIFTDMNFINKNFNLFNMINFSRYDKDHTLKRTQDLILKNQHYWHDFSDSIIFCNHIGNNPYMYKKLDYRIELYTKKDYKSQKEIWNLPSWSLFPNYKIEVFYDVWGLPDYIKLTIKEGLSDIEIMHALNELQDKISNTRNNIMSISKYGEKLKIVFSFP